MPPPIVAPCPLFEPGAKMELLEPPAIVEYDA
jgi:hypothetical protein